MSLALSILDQHAVSTRPPGAAERMRSARPDLLIADRESARLPIGRFAALGGERVSLDFVVARDRPGASGWSVQDPEVAGFLRLAEARGAWLAPPGAGDLASLALEGLAAPGRLFATLGPAPEAGALGALALPVGELEALSLLLGDPLEVEPGPPCRIELSGERPPRCDGLDVAAALIAARPNAIAGAWFEIAGDGLGTLGISDRVALARALHAAGAGVVIFPCDDRARDFLRRRGRESEWRRTEAGAGGGARWPFDLGATVPHAISMRSPTRAIPLSWWSGVSVASVEVGPGIPAEGLARFAAALAGRDVRHGAATRVTASTARTATSAEAESFAAALGDAGVHWVREGDIGPWKHREGALRLHAGAGLGPEPPAEDDWRVGVVAAAEGACRGRIEDPHAWAEAGDVDEPGFAPVAAPRLPASRATDTPPPRPRPRGSRHPAGVRGAVLGRLPGNLEADSLLPMGPRLREHLASPEWLADHVVPAARAPGIPAARPGGVWLLVMGEVRAVEQREPGILALAALGVRAVIAAGVEPRARTLFARAGVLVLRALQAGDLDAVRPGDELELVGGLDAFAPDRARVVRDLTRGFALVVLPELPEREWNWVLAGGSAVRRAGASC